MTFKVGDKVIVTNQGERTPFSGTFPVGHIGTVRYVYPHNMCQPYEVCLEGNGTYHFIENLTLFNGDPVDFLRAAVIAVRATGAEVEATVTVKKVVETVDTVTL